LWVFWPPPLSHTRFCYRCDYCLLSPRFTYDAFSVCRLCQACYFQNYFRLLVYSAVQLSIPFYFILVFWLLVIPIFIMKIFMSLHSLFVERNIKWKYLSHMKQKYIYQIVYVTPLSFWRAKHNMKIFYWFWHSPKMSFVTLQSWKSLCLDSHFGERN